MAMFTTGSIMKKIAMSPPWETASSSMLLNRFPSEVNEMDEEEGGGTFSSLPRQTGQWFARTGQCSSLARHPDMD